MMICDAHADTLFQMYKNPGGDHDVTLERLQAGGVALQVLAMFVGVSSQPEDIRAAMEGLKKAHQDLLKAGWQQAFDPSEAVEGEVRFMLSIEGCEPFEGGLETILPYRELGVRMAGITWNHPNKLGTPASLNQEEGLSAYGIKASREMQRLGMAIDVSHLNIPGFYDLLNKTDKPPLASHSCCRALSNHSRNLTDQQLKDLFKAGGYVGINFLPYFLVDEGQPCGLEDVVRHIDHMHQMGGGGMVGMGSDFDGISQKPKGLENPADFPALMDALAKRGYQEKDLKDIAGQNFIRYFQRIF